ncbi:sensor histidine kinase [Rhodococcoides corynebacterioides]|uniref:histidine kinase n=1 Tax=Rhodococcoides corynebacterioides TaxID=53972 RepID=A0ABS7P4J6_9NOCA|nr:sensor histidine kinase [Rhodococcus corynebacterioides]MBY6367334.1 sensor histidine kinase [Rhodococcus corynebacterioides]MBY6409614.1 sensor histidine kinase [Rhodococcus corynebacterioides]
MRPARVRLRRRRRTLAGQVLILQLAVVAVVLGAVAAVSVHQSTREFRDLQGGRMLSVAESLASTPIVREQLDAPLVEQVLAPDVDRAAALSGATVAEIVAPDGRVLVSTDPTRVRGVADLGDSDAVRGRGWYGDVTVDGRTSIAGHVPVLDTDGRVLAVVTVSENYPSTWMLLSGSGARLLIYLGIGAGLGAVGSVLLSRRVRRHTLGLETAEIATLADHREALLHSIREGVIAVDTDGRITMINDSAVALLGVEPGVVGRPVDEVGIDPGLAAVLLGQGEVEDLVITTATRVLAVNRRSATIRATGRGAGRGGQSIGTVTTMRDSTELASMQSQLTSHKSVTDTLRAQTHEFANQLHTISGLAQLGSYDEVTALVGTLTRRRAEISESITAHVHDPAVAALLIAKTSLAAEVGVRLDLDPASHLRALDPALSTDVITVVGNLVDNALDVSRDSGAERIVVRLQDRPDLLVEVTDSGPGVPPEMRDVVFSRGVTSKPDTPGGRGIGLALVRLVSVQHGGTAVVDDADTGGARFRVRIPLG